MADIKDFYDIYVLDEIQSSKRWGLEMVELYQSGDIIE